MSSEGSFVQLSSFPAEVLVEVFLASIPPLGSEGPRAHFPWSLSHVCRHWRSAVLCFPKLWSFLDVEQTQENEENRSPTLDLMETYLKRSGKHPLTFRLVYDAGETIHGHPFLECLLQHSARWGTVHIESPVLLALETLSIGDAEDFPALRSLVWSYCEFDSDAVGQNVILYPIPWAQLERYHECECSWYPDDERQWTIIDELTAVVDLRATFYNPRTAWVSEVDSVIGMPHLRLASFAVDRRADDLTIDEILTCFEFRHLEGLNLKLPTSHPSDVLFPVPGQLKALKVLRLCGGLKSRTRRSRVS
ncbi:hypothetical protein C8R44DRAFT_766379 [Mycena epipterygia]|nr:hypothetical protein C8R44DRAFT_766379 [Mycena epipterygia]